MAVDVFFSWYLGTWSVLGLRLVNGHDNNHDALTSLGTIMETALNYYNTYICFLVGGNAHPRQYLHPRAACLFPTVTLLQCSI